MFERFTDRARRVVVLAQEEARALNHNYIDTEHVLLGLIREGEGVAAKALESLGVPLEMTRQLVEEIIGHGVEGPTGHIPFTPRAKKVLELSLREALQLGHNYIGTEHVLLGLIREGEGVGAQVLTKLGATLDKVREEVIGLLHGYGPDHPEKGEWWERPPSVQLSRRSKAVIVLADEIAEKRGRTNIEPEDLLRALLALGMGDPKMRDALKEVGVEADEARFRSLSWGTRREEEPEDPEARGKTDA